MEGIPAWLILGVLIAYGLMGLSLVPAFVAVGLLLTGRPRQALTLFAAALLCEAVVCAAFCFLLAVSAREHLASMLSLGLTGLSLLVAGSGQFVAARRGPRAYAVAMGLAAGAVLVIVAGASRHSLPVAVASLAPAVASLVIAVLVPFGPRRAGPERPEDSGPIESQ